MANIKKHTDWVTALAFSPDGVLLATGDRNGGLYIWEAGTGNEFHNLRAHEKRIASLAWRGDSNVLAAGSEDGNMTWWEMANGTQVKKIASHGGVLALGYAPDGRLVSGGRDGHVRIWDGNAKQLRDWVPSGGEVVLKAIFNDDGTRVLTGAWNGEVKVQDASSEAPALVLAGNPPSIETRVAALEKEIQGQRQASLRAAAVLLEKESALAALKQEAANAGQVVAAAEMRTGVLERSLARWKAAKYHKAASALRKEARTLKEKWDNSREELAGLEAAVTAAPAGPQAQRLTELRQLLTLLPAEAETKQKSADTAWQEYLGMLPK